MVFEMLSINSTAFNTHSQDSNAAMYALTQVCTNSKKLRRRSASELPGVMCAHTLAYPITIPVNAMKVSTASTCDIESAVLLVLMQIINILFHFTCFKINQTKLKFLTDIKMLK